MKKIFTLALASIMLFSCSKEEIWTAQETGQLSVNVEEGASIFVETKASVETGNFKLKVLQDGTTEKYNGTVAEFSSPMVLPVGTYTVSAENISAEQAIEGRGAQRLAAKNTSVVVSANETTEIDLTCEMVNSKVSFVFDDTFKAAFDIANTLITESSRGITWSNAAELDKEIAFFEPGELNYTISTKKDGVDKEYSDKITLTAKTWHKLTVKASTANGQLSITVSADDEVAEDEQDITVNPY
ncbi:MAG: DUF4493 domain-containing protein [Bacteroidia bacterium]|nr:DUF4493 domain-containing protein [Bacteroidia bacterium]